MKLSSLKVAIFFIISLCILSLIVGFLTYRNTLTVLGVWNDSNKMLVFLKTDTNETQRLALIEKIKATENVTSVELVDRKTAGQDFQKSLKEFSNSLLTSDELMDLIPETLEVDLKKQFSLSERQKAFEQLALLLKPEAQVEEVSYSSTWLQKFEKIDQLFRSIGYVVFILMLALMSYLISLMMRVYIDDAKAEIEIYNLLGATRWSIYKLYLNDLIAFVVFSLIVALGLSFLLFKYFKNFMLGSGLSKILSDNITFLQPSEIFVLMLVFSGVILTHSFLTIYSSVNKLNQISND